MTPFANIPDPHKLRMDRLNAVKDRLEQAETYLRSEPVLMEMLHKMLAEIHRIRIQE